MHFTNVMWPPRTRLTLLLCSSITEIRTPLNTVCVGLELLQEEFRDKIDQDAKTLLINKALGTSPGTPPPPPTDLSDNMGEMTASSSGGSSEDKGDEDSPDSTQYWLELTGDIWENTQNAVSVLNDLLNYDKIESGTFFKLEFGSVDIWRLVRKTVEFSLPVQNSSMSPDLVVDDKHQLGMGKVLRVGGDGVRLTQAIRNLISNAIKFSPEKGSVLVSASYLPDGLPEAGPLGAGDEGELTSCPRAGSICISVKDNGAGLSQEALGAVFGEGVQFDANKLQAGGGSGPGL